MYQFQLYHYQKVAIFEYLELLAFRIIFFACGLFAYTANTFSYASNKFFPPYTMHVSLVHINLQGVFFWCSALQTWFEFGCNRWTPLHAVFIYPPFLQAFGKQHLLQGQGVFEDSLISHSMQDAQGLWSGLMFRGLPGASSAALSIISALTGFCSSKQRTEIYYLWKPSFSSSVS